MYTWWEKRKKEVGCKNQRFWRLWFISEILKALIHTCLNDISQHYSCMLVLPEYNFFLIYRWDYSPNDEVVLSIAAYLFFYILKLIWPFKLVRKKSQITTSIWAIQGQEYSIKERKGKSNRNSRINYNLYHTHIRWGTLAKQSGLWFLN